MGLILDTSILIATERQGLGVEDILDHAQMAHGEVDVAISTVSVVSLSTASTGPEPMQIVRADESSRKGFSKT